MARLSEGRDQKRNRSAVSKVEHRSTTDKTLANYLDAMLHDVTTRLESVQESTQTQPETDSNSIEITPEPDLASLAPSPKETAKPVQEEKALLSPQVAPQPPEVAQPEGPPVVDEVAESDREASLEALDVWLENGRPAWAQERFDCLVFVVDGLRLAVPLLLLGNIHPLDRPLTPLFDQPKWFLGLLSLAQERTIRVVDTASLVMPERYRPESAQELGYAVGVYDSDWAFGCHQIEGSISLAPEQVKWRSSRTSRPWLAGTVIDEMCALVDLHAFSRTLETGQHR